MLTGHENCVGSPLGDLQDFFDRIGLLEIEEVLGAQLGSQFPPLVAGVDDNGPKTHRRRQLDSLDTNTAAATGEDRPLARSETTFLD